MPVEFLGLAASTMMMSVVASFGDDDIEETAKDAL